MPRGVPAAKRFIPCVDVRGAPPDIRSVEGCPVAGREPRDIEKAPRGWAGTKG